MCVHIKESDKRLLELVNKFNRLAKYKIEKFDIYKLIMRFLKKKTKTMPFTIIAKYPGASGTEVFRTFYEEKHKPMMKELEEHTPLHSHVQ